MAGASLTISVSLSRVPSTADSAEWDSNPSVTAISCATCATPLFIVYRRPHNFNWGIGRAAHPLRRATRPPLPTHRGAHLRARRSHSGAGSRGASPEVTRLCAYARLRCGGHLAQPSIEATGLVIDIVLFVYLWGHKAVRPFRPRGVWTHRDRPCTHGAARVQFLLYFTVTASARAPRVIQKHHTRVRHAGAVHER